MKFDFPLYVWVVLNPSRQFDIIINAINYIYIEFYKIIRNPFIHLYIVIL